MLLLGSHPPTCQALPKSDSEINDALLQGSHAPRAPGPQLRLARSHRALAAELLAARGIIKKAMLKGVAPDVGSTMAG